MLHARFGDLQGQFQRSRHQVVLKVLEWVPDLVREPRHQAVICGRLRRPGGDDVGPLFAHHAPRGEEPSEEPAQELPLGHVVLAAGH
jgi:hypothetical protein